MKCEREKIFNYLSDLLNEEEKRIIKNHLINCPICQKYQREFQLVKEELDKKESIPNYYFFYEKLQERIKVKRKKKIFVLVSSLAVSFVLLFFFSLTLWKKEKHTIEEYVLSEEDYETMIYNFSTNDEEEILRELVKEIKERDLILLEETLEEEKDYYDLIFSLDKEELEYLIKNLNKKGG